MAETIETVSIAREVRDRFLRYAMSVVKERALPDIRDGLKPVQRRILFSMYYDANLTFDRKAAKSAKIVGDVMGNYHPHGDGAIYEALVRMSQEWVMRVPLVHGEGNFGSVDGDPPAAYRYTEAKLTRPATALLAELDQETIDYRDNYAGNKKEPIVLPAQFPNLLVNGTSGIAVGMASNIPPHNLGEVLRGCVYLIDNPDATVAQLLDRVKGPDFPLGGKIVSDRATLRKIYEEGSGSIRIQGEWKLEDQGRGRQQLVVTSIPYGVNKGALEATIGQLIEDRKLPQLLSVSNESNDKEGMRIVLEIKPGTDPQLVMAYLYKHTELQKTFSYNMTALIPTADGKAMVPKDGLSLKEFLQHFLDFRMRTVRRRFEYVLRQLRRRIHILDGFRVIFNALDRAIKLIRESTGKPDAAEKLKAMEDKMAPFAGRLGTLQPSERKTVRSALTKLAQVSSLSTKQFEELGEAVLTSWEAGRLKELVHDIANSTDMTADGLIDLLMEANVLTALNAYEAIKTKLSIIEELRRLVEKQELENAVRDYIAKNPWLVSPQWETFKKETSLKKLIAEIATSKRIEPEKQWSRRVDLLLASGETILVLEFMQPDKKVDLDHIARFEYYVTTIRTHFQANSGQQFRHCVGYLVASKLDQDAAILQIIESKKANNLYYLDWGTLLVQAERQYEEFIEILRERAPEDARLKELQLV